MTWERNRVCPYPFLCLHAHVAGQPFTVHGMRSTFRQWCEREKVRCEVAETALGHRIGNKVERS